MRPIQNDVYGGFYEAVIDGSDGYIHPVLCDRG